MYSHHRQNQPLYDAQYTSGVLFTSGSMVPKDIRQGINVDKQGRENNWGVNENIIPNFTD